MTQKRFPGKKGVPAILDLKASSIPVGTVLKMTVLSEPVNGKVQVSYEGLLPQLSFDPAAVLAGNAGDTLRIPLNVLAPDDTFRTISYAAEVVGDTEGVEAQISLSNVLVRLDKCGAYTIKVTAIGTYGSDEQLLKVRCKWPVPVIEKFPAQIVIPKGETLDPANIPGLTFTADPTDNVAVEVVPDNYRMLSTVSAISAPSVGLRASKCGNTAFTVTVRGNDGKAEVRIPVLIVEPKFGTDVSNIKLRVGESYTRLDLGLSWSDDVVPHQPFGYIAAANDIAEGMIDPQRGVIQLKGIRPGVTVLTYRICAEDNTVLGDLPIYITVVDDDAEGDSPATMPEEGTDDAPLVTEPEAGGEGASPDTELSLPTSIQFIDDPTVDGVLNVYPGQVLVLRTCAQWALPEQGGVLPTMLAASAHADYDTGGIFTFRAWEDDGGDTFVEIAVADVITPDELGTYTCHYEQVYLGGRAIRDFKVTVAVQPNGL